jgi:hypothetical protein
MFVFLCLLDEVMPRLVETTYHRAFKIGKEVIVRKSTTAWAEIDSGCTNSVSYWFVVDTKKDEFALFSSHLLTR